MTTIHDRHEDVDAGKQGTAWDERAVVGSFKGLVWWAAVLLAFAIAAIAGIVDTHRIGTLGRVYQIGYVLGCLLAVCLVRRRNLFGPMVQPPLVFALTAVGAALQHDSGLLHGGGRQLIFGVALPLTSNFPTMAITTGVTVAIGLARLWFQRNPEPPVRQNVSGSRVGQSSRPGSGAKSGGDLADRPRPAIDRAAGARGPGRPERAADGAAPPVKPQRGARFDRQPDAERASQRGGPAPGQSRQAPDQRPPGPAADRGGQGVRDNRGGRFGDRGQSGGRGFGGGKPPEAPGRRPDPAQGDRPRRREPGWDQNPQRGERRPQRPRRDEDYR